MEAVSPIRPMTDDIFKLRVYPRETSDVDIVGEGGLLRRAVAEFGKRIIRGTALALWNEENNHPVRDTEYIFRRRIRECLPIRRGLEIGTWRGLGTAVLAHYADTVATVDIAYYGEAANLWLAFGILPKIDYYVVRGNEEKSFVLADLDFDFAFVDGDHKYNEIALDFELVKKCGRVLFHDYGMDHLPDVTDFVDTLPRREVTIDRPFAYWQANGTHY